METTTDAALGSKLRENSADRETSARFGIGHVLVPLDGSGLAKRPLCFAALLAQTCNARLTFLRVLEPHHGLPEERHVDPFEWEVCQAAARNELCQTAADFASLGVPAEIQVRQGDAAEQIIRFAEKEGVGLIALSSHGAAGLSAWRLGSTAQRVVLRAPTSILLVPAHAPIAAAMGAVRPSKLLLPLDCSLRAQCALPLAVSLARVCDGELILAHAVPEPELPRRMTPSAADIDLAHRLVERNRCAAERCLAELQRSLAGQGVRARVRIVVSSHCASALCKLADEEHVDLVVVSAHGQTGDTGERYGGVAARMIQRCNKPMIILRDLGELIRRVDLAEEMVREHPGH